MKWINRNDSTQNYEDRRGRGVKRGAAFGGIGAIIIAIIALLLGKNPFQAIDMVNSVVPGQTLEEVVDQSRINENEDLKVFTLGVFNSANDVWTELFKKQLGETYRAPTLVTFTDATSSGCGHASSAVGPFYCPADEKVYIDLNFFHQLVRDYGARGEMAIAYVTAHEVGHHVQKLMGIMDQVNQYRGRISEKEFNRLMVKLELQADFFAGLWANQAQRMNTIIIEENDLDSAISATTAVGDDTLQKQSMGYTVPDSFTHGTSAQRTAWYKKGFLTGDVRQGDTFNDPSLR
ncbi:MAG: neutral zinc metallopeptidase [Bacteroidia bacterium]|nr:neutral zinc metallopeptidase [Bacteroidia bacterium]